MELAVEEVGTQKKKIKITIPKDVVSSRINDAYRKLNQQLKMPGFRSGKIPQKILEKQIPVQSLTEVFQEMMQDYYEKALNETGIVPVGAPEINHSELQDVKKDAPISFSVTLDVKPDIKIQGYKGLKFKKKEPQVNDGELDKAIHNVLCQYGHLEHHEDDHAAEKADFLTIDFDGFLKGEALENGSAQNFKVRIGEKKMIEGFEDQLIGHKLNEEFEIKAVLPANWNNKIRRVSLPVPGDEKKALEDMATFKVKIRELQKQVVPELNNDFAEKEGFENVEKFRIAVKTDLQGHKERQEEIRIKEEIFNKIVKENDVSPPESLINNELKFMIDGMKFQIEQSGMSLEDSGFEQEKAEKEWQERAEFNSKGYMLLEAIAAQENIHVTQSDLENEYKKLAEQTKQKPDEIQKRLMANPDSMKFTSSKILGTKTINFIYSHCEFEYVKEDRETEENKAKK